jgi:hypothetical protein
LSPFPFSQELNALRASVFQKLLAKYRAGKVQYQDLKRELEKLSGEPGTPYFENTLLLSFPLLFLRF